MEVFVSLLCLGTTLFLWLVLYARFKKKYSPDATVEKAGKVLNKMLIDLNSNAERNITLVNDRIAELKQVISEADKRILYLKSQHTAARPTEIYKYEQAKKATPVMKEAAPPVQPSQPAVPVPPPQPAEPAKEEKDYRAEIQKLAALGMTVDDIAAEVGLSTQEVKFTLEFS